jgi:hypothetical protein
VGEDVPLIQLLLRSPDLHQSISGKLAVAEALQDFALLLGEAEDLELTALQVLELSDLVVPRGNSPEAGSVAGQLELHFHCGHALMKFFLQLAQGIGPIQFRLIPLLLRLNHLANDDLKALALAPFETLATTEHGL